MTDFANVGFSSSVSALKLIKEGSGSASIPATGTPSSEYTRLTIPHGYNGDGLIYRVMVNLPSYPTYNNYFVVPFAVAGLYATPSIDSTNLNIEVGQSGFLLPLQNFNYYYRVFVP